MSYPVRLLESAYADLDEAKDWYRVSRPGLEIDFLLCIEEALDRIGDHPLAYARVDGEFRRAMAHRFPFGIFYRLYREEIIVIAIQHTSRDPRIWKARIH